MKKELKKNGFTLIEILIAIMIIITASTVIVTVLSSSFKGVSKSTASEEVRQNGNSAVTKMSRAIQFAKGFDSSSIDGTNYSTGCEAGSFKAIKIKSASVDQKINLKCDATANSLTLDGESLIDNSKITINSCSFTCSQANLTVSPVIGINFKLSKTGSVPEKSATVSFTTSVKMRNF